jgi:hypothetical protein
MNFVWLDSFMTLLFYCDVSAFAGEIGYGKMRIPARRGLVVSRFVVSGVGLQRLQASAFTFTVV